MTLSIVDEGPIWKNRYPASRSLVTLKGRSVDLGGGEILHMMQMGQARLSSDSRCMLTRSTDYGKTWSPPAPLLWDDGNTVVANGGAISMARDGGLWAALAHNEYVCPEDARYTADNGGWISTRNFLCRSENRGQTWTQEMPVNVAPPRGGYHVISSPVYELVSSELMLVFEPFLIDTLAGLEHEVALCFSSDGGRTWSDKTIIAKDPAQRVAYFDPRIASLADGRWVCLYWTHDRKTDESHQMSIAWSDDAHAWTQPQSTPLWGFLSLPLTLQDGRLLAVYNHRRAPQGIRCCVSPDGGKSWDLDQEWVLWDRAQMRITGALAKSSQSQAWQDNVLADMFTKFDFGIPHPMLLDDGSVFVTFYATQGDHIMHQRYVRFRIE